MRARAVLRERLAGRREEIEQATLTRVRSIADPAEIADPAYAEGLRASVAAAVGYGIETTGREGADLPIPVALLAQARLAARAGIPLDTVLRRYFAGYSLLGYFILEEATNAGLTDGRELKRLLGVHAGTFDRLLTAVSAEHARETEARTMATGERRHAERIERLLAGEPVDASAIPYDFEGCHVGVALAGPALSETPLSDLATRLDARLLILVGEDDLLFAWLGARRRLDPAELIDALEPFAEAHGCPIALGEPAEALAGWRLTHRQALAALRVARRVPANVARYAEVALLACALQDDLLAESLRRIYLEPLTKERDGAVLRDTLRAYLDAGGSLSGAATLAGVSRQTVSNRLRRIERRIGRPVYSSLADIAAALQLEESAAEATGESTARLS